MRERGLDEVDNQEIDTIVELLSLRAIKKDANRIRLYVENTIWQCDNDQFQSHFRMSRTTFNHILRRLWPLLDSPRELGRQFTRKLNKLLAVVWLLATPESYRSVAERFDMSKSDLFLAFVKVVTALNTIAPEIVVWPNREQRQDIVQGFERIAGIRGVVGAVDGTYIRIKTPKVHPQSYTCRKFYSSMTLQGISDHNLYFLDCFTGYPGSVADIRIFRNSDIREQLVNNRNEYLDDDQFIIGDKAYPVETWCVPPYVANYELTPRQTNFNTAHARTRTAIERAWALLFGRFRRLQYLDMSRIDLIPSTIIACCVLHNICRMDPEHLLTLFEREGEIFMGGDNGGDRVNHDDDDDDDDYFYDDDNAGIDINVINENGDQRRDRLADILMPR